MRWLVALFGCATFVGACERAEREIVPFQPSEVTVGSGSQNNFSSAGGGGAGGGGGGGGDGGQGGGSFCDGPGVFCQECAVCMLTTECSTLLNDCNGQVECELALDCLSICRDGCVNDPTCLEGCHASCQQSAPGYGAALDVLDCFCRDGCPTSCASQFSSECIVYLP